MRKSLFMLVVTAALPLGGCAYGLGGQDVLGSVLGDVLGGNSNRGMGGQSFEGAAVDACTYEARRHGQASVTNVRQVGDRTLRVYGTLQTNNSYQRRTFECDFRDDGRITDFDID